MSELEQKVFDFVECWQLVSDDMLFRQRFAESHEDKEKCKIAIDSLVKQGKITQLLVQLPDQETMRCVLFPAKSILVKWV